MSASAVPPKGATPMRAQDVTPAANRDLRRAWIFVALLPVALAAAVLIANGLLALQGYSSDDANLPASAALIAGLPAALIVTATGLTSTVFGLRARALGREAGLLPAVIGGIAGIGFLLQNIAAFLFG